ncbi:MAG: VWA domain-containing protein [Planctomycetota bacterium]|nr:VWA domain-containing protein [Planctomycetota bacterium]MDA1141743.1 VWA domain-containing protein [Planctomycetota bacterium]
MSLQLNNPFGLILLLAIPVALFYGLTSFDTARGFRKQLMLGLRAVVIVAVVLDFADLRIILPSHEDRICTYYLVDVSESLSDKNISEAVAYIRKAQDSFDDGNLAGLITFSGAPVLELRADDEITADSLVEQIQGARKRRVRGAEGRTNTNIEAAIDLAIAAFPEGTARRIVLLSDLNETSGQAKTAVQRAAEAHIEVDIITLNRSTEPEALLYALEVPSEVKLGESFNIQVRVSASQPCAVTIHLYRNGYLVGRKGTDAEPLQLPAGLTRVTFRQSLDAGGRFLYGARLEMADPEQPDNPDNNSVYAFTEVKSKPRLLLLAEAADELGALADALRGSSYEVEVRDAHGVPQTLLDLQNYDAVVMGNIPANRLHENQFKLIHDYVHDFGGGFVMFGGKNSFGPGGYGGTPVEALLPVKVRLTEQQAPSLGIVIIADTSKSMLYLPDAKAEVSRIDAENTLKQITDGRVRGALTNFLQTHPANTFAGSDVLRVYHNLESLRGDDGLKALPDRLKIASLGGIDKPAIVRTAVSLVIDRLTEKDYIGLVTLGSYDLAPKWVIPLQKALDKETLKKEGLRIPFNTFSHALGPFQMAQSGLARVEAAYRHIVLISDGYLPTTNDFAAYAAQLAADGLTVSTVGVGEGCNERYLQKIARWGNGRFYWIKEEEDVGGAFSRELDEFQKEVVVEGPVKAEKILDHDALQGVNIDLSPYLFGYVRTQARLDARVPLAIPPEMDPLLAFTNFGSGRTAAFTSDASYKWAEGWIKDWPRGFAMLWSQTIGSVIRESSGSQLIPDIGIKGRKLTIALDAVDEDDRFMNDLEAQCELFYLGRKGRVFSSSSRTVLRLPLIAPGRFSAETSVDKDGVYLARMVAKNKEAKGKENVAAESDASKELVRTVGIVVSSSLEFARLSTDQALAESITIATGGDINPGPESVFRASEKSIRLKDYGVWFLILAALLFVGDCLARRWPAVSLFWEGRKS